MKQLIAVFPILFESQNYEPGDELPTHNAGLVEVWIGNGTAIWRDTEEPKKRSAKASDERIAIEAFMQSTHKNMCFEYDTSMEAKKKLSTINAARRSKNETDIYDTYRIDKCVYIVRQEKKKGK